MSADFASMVKSGTTAATIKQVANVLQGHPELTSERIERLLELEELITDEKFSSNQNRVKNREELFELLNIEVEKMDFDTLYKKCLELEKTR